MYMFYYYLKLHISKTDDINLGTHNNVLLLFKITYF